MNPGSPWPIDSMGIWNATVTLPEQILDSVECARDSLLNDPILSSRYPDYVENVVVFGVGTSGVVGDVLAEMSSNTSKTPIFVVKSGKCPAWVGPNTVAIAISYSGNTKETLQATTCALNAQAHLLVLSAGGELRSLAKESALPSIDISGKIPQTRAALGVLCVAGSALLEYCGILTNGLDRIEAAARSLQSKRDRFIEDGMKSLPAMLSKRIGRTIPLIHGSPGLVGVAARRWKTQINENAKSPAFFSNQPELSYDEIAGWGQHGDVTRQVISLVSLRYQGEDPLITKRIDVCDELIDEVVSDVIEVWSEETDDLSVFFELVLLGDLVSLHLAGGDGIDPGPVPAIESIRDRL